MSRPFVDNFVFSSSLSEEEAKSIWNGLVKSLDSYVLLDFGLLCNQICGKNTSSNSVSISSLFSLETSFALEQPLMSVKQVSVAHIAVLKLLFAEVKRLDAVFSRETAVSESVGRALLARCEADRSRVSASDLSKVLHDLEALVSASALNRSALLWLTSRLAAEASLLDVASILVMLEHQSFWQPPPALLQAYDACAQACFLLNSDPSFLLNSDPSLSADGSAKKKGGKKKKLKQKIRKSGGVVGLLQPERGTREGKVLRRLCFWVRPWMEYAAKCALLSLLVPVSREEQSHRVHLDNKNWYRYKQSVKALDSSLVNRSASLAEGCAVAMEWTPAGSAKATMMKANGSVLEEFLSSGQCSALLSGDLGTVDVSDLSVADAVNQDSLIPSVRCSSRRSLFVGGNVSVVYDASISFASAAEGPAVSCLVIPLFCCFCF